MHPMGWVRKGGGGPGGGGGGCLVGGVVIFSIYDIINIWIVKYLSYFSMYLSLQCFYIL